VPAQSAALSTAPCSWLDAASEVVTTPATSVNAGLCVPDAIAFLERALPGGFAAVRSRNRALALEARTLLGDVLGVEAPAPDTMIGSLCALRLPDSDGTPRGWREQDPLYDALFSRHRIEVPVFAWPAPPRRMIRIAAQLYNSIADYQRLADALCIELPDLRGTR
jgi:isopenicillin-N epimerase